MPRAVAVRRTRGRVETVLPLPGVVRAPGPGLDRRRCGLVHARTGGAGSAGRGNAPHAPGGPTTTMMSSVRNIYDLAADDEHIYVSAIGARLGQGKILRMRKVP